LRFELTENLEFEAEGAIVRRTVLPSGVRVLTESVPGASSVALSLSLAVGSRDEHHGTFGATHFLEHLLFRGTEKRTALEISQLFDSVGGSSNAETGKEATSYYARVAANRLELALDLLLDMYFNATLQAEDFELERGVILEELAMAADDPEDVAHEALSLALLPSHPLGRPIGGTNESIASVTRDQVWQHYRDRYAPQALVIAVAGAVDHAAVVSQVSQFLHDARIDAAAEPIARRSIVSDNLLAPEPRNVVSKDIAQANLLIGTHGLETNHPERYAMGVLNTILGGGMSSRLYQEIRERRGLAYTTYSFHHPYSDLGQFAIYAGCAPSHAKEVLGLMSSILADMGERGPDSEELQLAHGHIAGGLALRLESNMAKMNRLVTAELNTGEYLSLSEAVERYNSVTAHDVRVLAARLAASPKSLVAVGEPLLADLIG